MLQRIQFVVLEPNDTQRNPSARLTGFYLSRHFRELRSGIAEKKLPIDSLGELYGIRPALLPRI